MKICIDARVIINHKTGIGNYTFNLLKALLEIDKKNEYLVFINKDLKKDNSLFSLEQHNLTKKVVDIRPVSIQQQFFINKALKEEHPDIYHYPNWDLPLFHRFKSIITIHDLTYLLHDKLYINFSFLKKIYTRVNIGAGLKKAKKVIVVSENTKNDLLNLYHIPTKKIKVIHEACEEGFSKHVKKNATGGELSGKLGKYFLFVGEKRPHKNLIRIIHAFDSFKRRTGTHKLVIVGKAYAGYNEPENLVHRLNLNDDVIFRGYVDTNELIKLYQDAEALVFPSIYEGFGIPILEAMSCGTPVITSNISATNEIAGDAAIKVNPYITKEIAVAMFKIATDKKLKDNLVQKGFVRAKDFSWRKNAEQTLQLYKEIFEIDNIKTRMHLSG